MSARWFYVSSSKMTCAVELDDANVVVYTPPILRRFIGQHSSSLSRWMRSQGGFRWERLP